MRPGRELCFDSPGVAEVSRFPDALDRAWPILIEAARMRRTVSYSELAGRAGPPLTARAIHKQLLNGLSARAAPRACPTWRPWSSARGRASLGGGWFVPIRSTAATL